MNSDIAAAKPAVLSALRKAETLTGIVRAHGWPLPPAYLDSQARLAAARTAAAAIPTIAPAPNHPKDINKWIDSAVDIRLREAARRDVTDELVLNLERETAAIGLTAAPDVTSRLAAVFDELVEEFDAHADAPREIFGHESSADLEAHTAALRFAGRLYGVLVERAMIADATGESADIGPDAVWLIIAPHAATTRDQVQDALATYKGTMPNTLDHWDALRPLGLRLAQLEEVPARRQRHSDFMHQMAMTTLDLGMRDHSYSEFEETQSGVPYGRRILGETDRIFDQAPSIRL